MSAARRWVPALLARLWLPALLVAAWWLASAQGGSLFFPPLQEILAEFGDVWVFERVGSDVVPSLRNLGIGMAIALVVGITAGVGLALSSFAERVADPFLQFARATPAIAILPLIIVAFGTGPAGKVAAIAFGSLWPILLNTIDGITSIDPEVRRTAAAFRVRRGLLLTRVLLPGALPQIAVGVRTSLSIGVVLMVGSEMYAATQGIGYVVIQAQQTFAITQMWSGIVLLGIIGYALNVGYAVLENWLLRWRPTTQSRV
ncbi:MAG: ABC transporter permease [Pseudonocardia sp.]|nr:ABC transporter permease [Pseudonocardia sp.]